MSDDEADPELMALLRDHLGLGPKSPSAPPTTGVLESAEYIYDNAIDVSVSAAGTKAAAENIWRLMQEKSYSTETWSQHELHPKAKDESSVNFVFTTNLLNFSFWSELPDDQRFAIEYKERMWTGYWSLVAAIHRALEEGYPITTPDFWQDLDACSDEALAHIFRSATAEPMPLLSERIAILREAGRILHDHFDSSVVNLIDRADNSAASLVNLLVTYFPNFRDETYFPLNSFRKVKLYKRAQIFVADLWACFNGISYGTFHDIDSITMFADYRIPQMLQSQGCILYSPVLTSRIARQEEITSGETCEVEIRGCSIWCVELIRRCIVREHPEANGKINAVLIDFFLYDSCKEKEKEEGGLGEMLPHHRTRSIWY